MNESMNYKDIKTLSVTINICGDLMLIEKICADFCTSIGLCITVTPTTFVYKGGRETGAKIGLEAYPRIPNKREELEELAWKLAQSLIVACNQNSALIVGNETSTWIYRKDSDYTSNENTDKKLTRYIQAINMIDDYFEYRNESTKDKDYVQKVLTDLCKELTS